MHVNKMMYNIYNTINIKKCHSVAFSMCALPLCGLNERRDINEPDNRKKPNPNPYQQEHVGVLWILTSVQTSTYESVIAAAIDMSQILIINHFENFHETRYNQI